jgi:hypothetical protein
MKFGTSSRYTYVRKNFCICGCGKEIPFKSKNRGEPLRFKHGHNWKTHPIIPKRGSEHSQWKGRRKIRKDGYVMVRAEWHPRAKQSSAFMIREHIND